MLLYIININNKSVYTCMVIPKFQVTIYYLINCHSPSPDRLVYQVSTVLIFSNIIIIIILYCNSVTHMWEGTTNIVFSALHIEFFIVFIYLLNTVN